ncbi:hypothetical protein OJAV_G00236150 [Oryzias javanicus]|uniref:Uncharacterized protein n=1 Tax=Oryzias javanicus TaxID=123683 RepID=A0A437BYA6_ORYJA|nr:hypothetical protein OJAV_G00236150 [Oryzias javanicus]
MTSSKIGGVHCEKQQLGTRPVDSSRVRTWNLNTRGRRYMETLVFSSIQDPQIDNTSPNVVPTTEDRWDSDVFFPGASMITIPGFPVFFP